MIDAWSKWWMVVLLGILTVGSYGLVAYGFGVLIGPIHDETGWPVGSLSAAFTLSMLAGGIGAVASGWLLDRVGGRPVILSSLAVGSVFLLLAAGSDSIGFFIVAWALGGGIIAAGLFYNVTMALTARLFTADRVRAFAILTFVGGFASVVYFPVTGLLVDVMGWRSALRVVVVLLVLHVLPAGLLVSGGAAPDDGRTTATTEGLGGFGGMFEALRSRVVVQMIGMFSLASMAFSAVQVLHVPAMTAAGASLGVATTVASVRGFLSLPGRALMGPVVERLGVPNAIGMAYVLMAAGSLPLAVGGRSVGSSSSWR